MKKSLLPAIIPLFLFMLCHLTPAQATETVEITSYLPSPTANVQTLILNPHTPSTTLGCTAGRLHIDTSGNLKVCRSNGSGNTNYFSPSGDWASSGNYIYPTDTATNSSLTVGIGTTAPVVKFHVKEGSFLTSQVTGGATDNNVLYFDAANGTLIAGYQSSALASLTGRGGVHSQTFGYNSLASGQYALAAGHSNTASGRYALTTGYSNTASGDSSVAFGAGATAAGGASFATGSSTTNGKYSTGIGVANTANGDMSVAIGWGNTTNNALGTASVNSVYTDPTSNPVGAVALGISNAVSGVGAVGLGYGNTVTGNYSGSLGYGITVTGSNSIGIGVSSGGKTFADDNSFAVMGGTSLFTTAATKPAWLDMTIGGTVYVVGRVVSDNSSVLVSDIRMKTGITPISDALSRIQQLNPIQYHLIKPSIDDTGRLIFDAKPENVLPEIHTGMAAQEVYKLFPDAVEKPADESKGIWLMSYEDFIPVLIEAVKEHKAETDILKARIDELETRLKALELK